VAAILDVLVNNILPIFLVAGFGFVLRKRIPDLVNRTITRLTFYVLSPCLVFSSLVSSQLKGAEIGRIALAATIGILLMGVIGYGFGRILRFGRTEMILLILAAMFSNVGNMGLPFNQLRYGEAGISRAIIYMFISSVIVYTVGVFITSLGKQTWQQALKDTFKLPIIYAVLSALIVYGLAIPVPQPIMSGITIAGEGSIPVMLILLGMNMADANGAIKWRVTLPAVATRLMIAPLVAALVAILLGLQGFARNVTIIEAAMPVAVASIVLTTEFDVEPETMTGIVVASTLLSPITLLVIITILGL
jgi:predicted permease